jgi:hypothetical protein
MCDQKAIAESCGILGNADAGLACACILTLTLLLIAATGAILRLGATSSTVVFLRLAGRATYRGVIFWRATR